MPTVHPKWRTPVRNILIVPAFADARSPAPAGWRALATDRPVPQEVITTTASMSGWPRARRIEGPTIIRRPERT
ncbi:hypothetical protein [Saccharopolyspora spinosa]|uniref:hypothetical protein n=1 Tax=Saccharopolyspora spinosa TaxID=60894 RepID=UPI00117B7E69|nr:hypothetical protein [Saccharopolyspora spinosa]